MVRTIRKSLRQTLDENDKAHSFYSSMSGKPKMESTMKMAPAKERLPAGSDGRPLEKDVLKAIMQLLHSHPKIAFAYRQNSGMMESEYNGQKSYTRFNTMKGMSDIAGMLKGGRALYIEVKRPGGKVSSEQLSFIQRVQMGGGFGIIAYSIADVISALK